jgi:cation diffusion facilitator family transporter
MVSEANRAKENAALVSIGVKTLMTLGKFAAGLTAGSLALLSEAGNNFADIMTSAITYFALRISHKPADEEHPYGYGKVESLAALLQTGLLFGLAVVILNEAIKRIINHDTAVEATPLAFGVLIVSILVDFFRWRSLSKLAKTTRSQALAAEALNFATDIIASSLALVGLIAAHFGYPMGDPIAALGVALFIAVAGYRIGRQTVESLVDTAPKGLSDAIRLITKSVPGVIKVGTIRLRPCGPEIFGDVGIFVSRTLPLENVDTIKANVAATIKVQHPEVALTVADIPIALDDETVLERVLLIAARRHVQIHHVTVQQIEAKISISFDVELDRWMQHGQAHEIASSLEHVIAQELGRDIEVETHIEPMDPSEIIGVEAPASTRAQIAAGLAQRSLEVPEISNVHNVRVRESSAGLVVNYHCRVDPRLSVDAVHDQVDELERKMQEDYPEIIRIVGHAEPSQHETYARSAAQ